VGEVNVTYPHVVLWHFSFYFATFVCELYDRSKLNRRVCLGGGLDFGGESFGGLTKSIF
jgi:hypothetical protein